MRKPYARTPSSKEIDRRVCFETTSKKGVLCASPYAQTLGGLGAWGPWGPWGLGRRRAWAKPSLLHPSSFFPHSSLLPAKTSPYATTHSYVGASGPSSFLLPPPSSFYQPNPVLQTMRAVNLMALGFRPLPPPFSLLSLPPPPSLLLLPAKPYARPYARCEFDGSGLCWRSRPFVPPPSVLPPSSCPLPAPLSLFYLKQAPMRSLCRPMRAPYARDTILIEFRSCTLLRNHSCA